MTRIVNTYISLGLYNELRKERDRLRLKEKRKRGRKRRITMIDASNSILGKITR